MVLEEDIGFFDDINDERDKIATDTLTSEDQKDVDQSFTLESTFSYDEEKDFKPYIHNEKDCIRATRKIDFEEKPKGNNKITFHNNQFNIKPQLEDFKRKQIGYKSQKTHGKCT